MLSNKFDVFGPKLRNLRLKLKKMECSGKSLQDVIILYNVN